MITIYSPEHRRHNPPHEFLNGALTPAHESPRRAEIIHAALADAALGPILPPATHGDEHIGAVHDSAYLRFLGHAYERWVAEGGAAAAVLPDSLGGRHTHRKPTSGLGEPGYYATDLGAPIVAATYAAARASANVALTAADMVLGGEPVAYALCRPPGHHAGHDFYGGYCYLNNAAIAAEYLLKAAHGTDRPRVAILDIDYHHGNGTQQIFYSRGDVLCVSLHADPDVEYPYFWGGANEQGQGAGRGANINIPLPIGTSEDKYMAALAGALAQITSFAPRTLVLSAGFDTFKGDPVAANGGGFTLSEPTYTHIGAAIAACQVPTVIVQEGGYAVEELGRNVVALLRGFAGHTYDTATN